MRIEGADACVSIQPPNRTTRWQIGTTQTIKWDATGSARSGLIFLHLLLNNQEFDVGNPSSSIGRFDWKIPTDLQPNSEYRIRATSVSVTGVVFLTPPFEIFSQSEQSSSPSGQNADGGMDPILVAILGTVFVIFIGIIVLLICGIILCLIVIFRFTRNRDSKYEILQPLSGGESDTIFVSRMHLEYNALEIKTSELILLERLGKGSFGIVFKASYRKSNVAVKMLEIESEGLEEFLKEAITMA